MCRTKVALADLGRMRSDLTVGRGVGFASKTIIIIITRTGLKKKKMKPMYIDTVTYTISYKALPDIHIKTWNCACAAVKVIYLPVILYRLLFFFLHQFIVFVLWPRYHFWLIPSRRPNLMPPGAIRFGCNDIS